MNECMANNVTRVGGHTYNGITGQVANSIGNRGKCRALLENLIRSSASVLDDYGGGHRHSTLKTSSPSASTVSNKVNPSQKLSRASVALILRVCPSLKMNIVIGDSMHSRNMFFEQIDRLSTSDIHLLFIKRCARTGDPWSGHLGLPGGKNEDLESDLDAAIRETYEEVGIDLNQSDGYACIGRLNDRRVRLHSKTLNMSYSAFVFWQQLEKSPEMKLSPGEVDAAFWVPLDLLTDNAAQFWNVRGVTKRQILFPQIQACIPRWLQTYCEMDLISFPAVDIAPYAKEVHFLNDEVRREYPLQKFPPLWGLTLSATSDLVSIEALYPRLDQPMIVPHSAFMRVLFSVYSFFVSFQKRLVD
uniref:Nudix hydrolase domain-containing protein n=1 Tax=Timspurckia oligopyrenoides TaxID=708627 RepID=A0A7S0ZCB3_9RHOD